MSIRQTIECNACGNTTTGWDTPPGWSYIQYGDASNSLNPRAIHGDEKHACSPKCLNSILFLSLSNKTLPECIWVKTTPTENKK